MKKVQKPNIPSTNDAIARPLVLAAEAGAIVEILVSTQLQEWHNWALSGFSLPHFGQYILILLFRFSHCLLLAFGFSGKLVTAFSQEQMVCTAYATLTTIGEALLASFHF